ncbi:MAG: cytochrome c biogenesis protein ResB [Thermodesulfobacteriota bacterium]|nr:cytochrome c biogenesis protein ResB [Thermodesulfobacteriota bacterium]
MYKKLYNLFSSTRLTIFLFFAIAATSILGTLIQQGLPIERYEQIYSQRVFSVMGFFDIFDMYHSWWFTLLLVLLSINIIACTLRQIPRIIRLTSSGKNPTDDEIFAASRTIKTWHSNRDIEALELQATKILTSLAKTPVHTKKDNTEYFFAEKGKTSRWGMILVHVSVLFILAGGMIGMIWGYSGQIILVEGESADTFSLFSGKGTKELGFDIICNHFSVDFYKTGMPKRYKTDLTIVDQGKEVMTGAITVNHPLHYKGLKFCQATYGIADTSSFQVAAENTVTGEKTVLTLDKMKKKPLPNSEIYFAVAKLLPDYKGRGPGVLGVLIEPDKAHDIFWIFKDKQTQRGAFAFRLKDYDKAYYTGIQVSKNPGTPFVRAGFIFMITGFILSLFFTHTRIWLRIRDTQKGHEISVVANASKNQKAFKEKIQGLAGRFQGDEF